MNDQPNYIIFKLYRNSHFSDKYLHSITNEYEKTIIDLASATKKHNRKLILHQAMGTTTQTFLSTRLISKFYITATNCHKRNETCT